MAKYPTRKRGFDLVGEGQVNADGTRRQDELRICLPGEAVTLEREPENLYDDNAVCVRSQRGAIIGYLSREDAAALAPSLDEGRKHQAIIGELTGGLPEYPSFGCRTHVTWEGQSPTQISPLRPEQSLYGKREQAEQSEHAGCLSAAVALTVLPLGALLWAGLGA